MDKPGEVEEELVQSVLKEESFQKMQNSFQEYCDLLRNENGTMSQFWMSYIDLVSTLLNLLRASREGNWILHLKSIREMLPWCFAYNRTNYSRYLPWYYREMQCLKVTHPEIHEYLQSGGFSCQIGSKNTFGRIPMDQTIEETINKDTQTAGGTKGFSTNKSAVSKYYITANDRANFIRQLRSMLDMKNQGFQHPDMTTARKQKDEEDVQSLANMLRETWKNPFVGNNDGLSSISTGAVPSPDAIRDMCHAREKGEDAYNDFVNERLGEDRTIDFFATLPKMKLQSFSKKSIKTKTSSEKEIELKADKNLFSMMTLVAQSRELDMKEVFSYPLGPVPWSLSTSEGSMRKTNKAALSQALEKLAPAEDSLIANIVTIIDGMSIVQKIKGAHKTFGELAGTIFRKVLAESGSSKRLDVIFDVYRKLSIKNIERVEKRGSLSAPKYKDILPNHRIQQWELFLKGSENKSSLIRFLALQWKQREYRDQLYEKEMFVAYDEECWRLTRNGIDKINELSTNQEEADTRMFLHVKSANEAGFSGALIVSEDTDVFVLAVYVASELENITIYQKRGTAARVRYVNISAITNSLGSMVSKCLPGLHAYTGCDTVSAFASKGKLKAFKLVQEEDLFQEMFTELGNSIVVRIFKLHIVCLVLRQFSTYIVFSSERNGTNNKI